MQRVNVTRSQFRHLDHKKNMQKFGDKLIKRNREEIEQRRVRQQALDLATFDPTRVVKVKRANCRWCWGANNEYQRTDWEMQRDLDRHIAASRRGITFNAMGGGGFNKWRDPNPDCPICFGRGEEIGFIQDFDKLSAKERNAIASVKFGKNGSVEEIKFHNKIDAINTFAKMDGMVVEKKVVRIIDATEEDLDEYFAKNGVTIDHNDPDFAPFLAKMIESPDQAVTDAESVDIEAGKGEVDSDRRNPDPDPA